MHFFGGRSNKTIEANRTIFREIFSWNIHHGKKAERVGICLLRDSIAKLNKNDEQVMANFCEAVKLIFFYWKRRDLNEFSMLWWQEIRLNALQVKRWQPPEIILAEIENSSWVSNLLDRVFDWFAYFNSKLRKAIWIRPKLRAKAVKKTL